MIKKYISPLFLSTRFYAALVLCVVLFLARFFITWLGDIPFLAVLVLGVIMVMDYILLFGKDKAIVAQRSMAERFSNGDDNEVRLDIKNRFSFTTQLQVIDEIPHQFQRRDVLF
ncbi:MAG: DUF58 domain-containing protein, partial [Deinococcales bacterium]|nr:DUF58 domain-containing protein [Chitinophagaceae bacterium]